MNVKLPKKYPSDLPKRVDKAIKSLLAGTANLSRSKLHGYLTIKLGYRERGVIVNETLHVFNKHPDYERFINKVQ